LRIALLTDGLWPFVIGGMQKHSYHLCKMFARQGIYVEVYHPLLKSREIDLRNIFSASELQYISITFVHFPVLPRFPGHYVVASFLYSKALFAELVKRNDFDIVYAKGLTGWYTLLKRNKLGFRKPVWINVHGYEYFQKAATLSTTIQQYMLRPAFTYINRHADLVFSYGAGITKIINRKIGKIRGKVVEVPAAIDKSSIVDEARPVESVRRLIFAGRYERRKGIEELFGVLSGIPFARPFEMHIVGSIPADVKKNIRGVQYHGEISDPEKLLELLSSCDVLICPSYAEGMPNVILEAMARGCAIIASDVGAVSEMVDKSNGWLIEPGSITSLRLAINECLTTPADGLMAMKRCSIERVQDRFTWDKVSHLYSGMFSNFKISTTGNPHPSVATG
jgi:glycosyltransferase involved in cell wall biosynthesis